MDTLSKAASAQHPSPSGMDPIAVPCFYGSRTCLLLPQQYKQFPNVTHEWTAFIRSPLVSLIKFVTFHLHESYEPNVITVDAPPFETSQQGFAEFNVTVDVNFHDSLQIDGQVNHVSFKIPIHLEDKPMESSIHQIKPIVKEIKDEIVFFGLSREQYDLIRHHMQAPIGWDRNMKGLLSIHQDITLYGQEFDEEKELKKIEEVRERIRKMQKEKLETQGQNNEKETA